MEPSDAADVLSELGDEQSGQILDEMEPEDKEEVEELLDFKDNTAGGIMDTGFLALPENATVADAMDELRRNEEVIEDLHNIFLVDAESRLRANVPVAKLFFAAGDTPLKEFAADPLISVQSNERQDRIAEVFDKYNLLALPVLDDNEELIGVITVDDVVALLRRS
jgi:Mg/Co/Ni transporter MgtE